MSTAMMIRHDPGPSAAPAAWSLLSAASIPAASHDIARVLGSPVASEHVSPVVRGDASVHVSEVICRVGAGEHAPAVVAAAHHIVVPRGGALACSTRGEVPARFVADPATALLVAPGDVVSVRNAAPGEHAATVITMAPELLELAIGDTSGPHRVGPASIALSRTAMLDVQRIRSIATMIHELRAEHPEVAASTLASATLALLRHLGLAGDRSVTATRVQRSASRSARVADAVRVMLAAEPGAQHTLDGLSERVGISAFHLARVFRARTGFSIHQYLLHIRMARALVALGDNETSLSRLALTLGFCSHSHFATTFRRHFGVSPRDVRAMLREWPAESQPLDECACIG